MALGSLAERGALFLAALLAFFVARRAPQHRPIHHALVGAIALDAVNALVMPWPRLDMAVALTFPALPAWAALRVFHAVRWPLLWAGVAWAPLFAAVAIWEPGPWWAAMYPLALSLSLVLHMGAWIRHAARRGPITIAQRVCKVLIAADAAALLSGVAHREEWEIAAWQSAVVLAFAALVQGLWLRSWWSSSGAKPRTRGGSGGGGSAFLSRTST